MNNLSTEFLKNITEKLMEKGWKKTSISNVDIALTKRDQKTIVTTTQNLFFINAEDMAQEDIQKTVEQIHQKIKTQPPLFPATNQIIFFYQKSFLEPGWILANGKKQDIARSNYTVSWVVDIHDKKLYTHKGMPLIKTGKNEIQKTLKQI